jgi:ectoine hydroxylase-related dioxygenase (phytanoyl-CoA dioxygenase family)
LIISISYANLAFPTALIEMTAITASYGAVAQYWHDDVVATASAINYARTFGPSYSVFIQLQNTTKGMGATGVCPGTHYCSDGLLDKFCEKEGFQLVNEEGYWATGDALLMNMNSYHRGSAHTDPDALDRVMLILTFVPRPEERAESRQMSQGITFSLRWDMWGHTLDDLAHGKF